MHLCITESSSCKPKTSPAGINSIPTENKHKFETKAEREEMLPLVATSGNSNWKTCVDGYFVVYQACRDLMKNHLSSINVLGWVLEKEFKREGRRSSGQSRYISFTRNFFLNPMKSLHTQQSHRNANQNYEVLPHTGQNDLCQKVYKQ